jgi:hypothetical protein
MYYEVVLTALPALLLFTEPERYVRPIVVAVLPAPGTKVDEELQAFHAPRSLCNPPPSLGFLSGGAHKAAVLNSVILTLLAFLGVVELTFPWLAITASVIAPRLDSKIVPTPLTFSTSILGTPWSTFCMVLLWFWCGVLTWRSK